MSGSTYFGKAFPTVSVYADGRVLVDGVALPDEEAARIIGLMRSAVGVDIFDEVRRSLLGADEAEK